MDASRDWADLSGGPTGLIADRVLAYDVADYVRFRAVCRPWRRCSAHPRAHSVLDRRFHPRRWTMLRDERAAPSRRSFLNTSTGACIQVDVPELHDHVVVAYTPEGLLVLLHDPQRTSIRLLNPLTRHLLTDLPPITTLLPRHAQRDLPRSVHCDYLERKFTACRSGIASDDSTVVLCFNQLVMLGMAKPGDDHWTMPLMLAGHFYCVTVQGIMVLETGADQPPRLHVAAKLNIDVRHNVHCMHLVNNCGELVLVHRRAREFVLPRKNKSWMCDTYRVDLNARMLFLVKSLGGGAGRAVFMGMNNSSLSVSLGIFPSGSICADTIYLSFDFEESEYSNIGAYHPRLGRMERATRRLGGLVPRPYTLVDCLSLSNSF
ncbi:hypothetical protein VPH35_048138 [Triticum aestivum]